MSAPSESVHYGREEAMQWLENNGGDYIFAFPGNSVLHGLIAKTADYLRIAHARGSKDKLRCFTSVEYPRRASGGTAASIEFGGVPHRTDRTDTPQAERSSAWTCRAISGAASWWFRCVP
jgi:hypothetical protein